MKFTFYNQRISILLAGLLRDKSGAYYMTFHMLSGIQLVGAVLALTLPITHKWHNQKPETDTK